MICSTPYRENSIVAIASAAVSLAQLECLCTTLYSARWQASAQQLPVIGPRLVKFLGRRAYADIPATQVAEFAKLQELVHVGTRRLLGKHWPALVASSMYRVKVHFDKAVARRLRRHPTKVFVGMYGASLESFRAVKSAGGLTVLNFVNSHPAEHNRYLADLAGLQEPHPEMVPGWVAQRVDMELALADLLLVPSRFVAGQLLAHGVSAEKIAILPYGVDLRSFYPAEPPTYDAEACHGGPLLECLYVGQISHRKGIAVLLEAARRCRHLALRFRLIGPIVSPEVLEGLPDNVIYAGASLPGGVPDAMRMADMFVQPTLEDSFALVVFEAMATALPVVTTTHAGSSELIEDGVDGLVVPAGDAVALTAALTRLVDQPALRGTMGLAARRKVQETHAWEAYGASVLRAIANCQAMKGNEQHALAGSGL